MMEKLDVETLKYVLQILRKEHSEQQDMIMAASDHYDVAIKNNWSVPVSPRCDDTVRSRGELLSEQGNSLERKEGVMQDKHLPMANPIVSNPVTTRDIQVRSDYKSCKKKSGGKPEMGCITDMYLYRHPEGTRVVNCCRYHGINCDASSSWIIFDDPDKPDMAIPPGM